MNFRQACTNHLARLNEMVTLPRKLPLGCGGGCDAASI